MNTAHDDIKSEGPPVVAEQRVVMPPQLEIERLEWRLAKIEAEIDMPQPLANLIRLCVLKHDCMESIARFRAMRHNVQSSATAAERDVEKKSDK